MHTGFPNRGPRSVAIYISVLLGGCLALPVVTFGQARLLQTVEGFYSPAAATFAEDGRTLFVTNAARGDYGMFAGRGAISRAVMGDAGQIELTEPRFVEGLNAPLGIAVLPAASGPLPKGTLMVAVGGSWTVDDRERALDDDRKRGTGAIFIDPASGEILGRLYLGKGSPVSEEIGHPILDPMSVAGDHAGNLFLTDIAGSGVRPLKPEEGVPGILRLTPAAVTAFLADEVPTPGSFQFIPVRNLPTGIAYARHDRSLYWITGQIAYDLGGAVLRLPDADFSGELETVEMELGSLLGLALTPRGTVVASRSTGDILIVRGRKDRVLKFRGRDKERFTSPGQPAAANLADGQVLIVLPEMSGGGRGPWRQRVRTFTLPDKY